jgi:AcrR family transcriptional regulator
MLVVVIGFSSLGGLAMNTNTKCEQCTCQVLVFSVENNQTGLMSAPPAPPDASIATPSAPRTARERVREEMTAEILAVAGAHVARDGAPALSLRSIARDLGMAPSALYRYFDGRDALLTALILTAYEALATEAERAADKAETAADPKAGSAGDAERWLAVPRTLRGWALEHPHQWGLIFGTPVPGYEAPEDTVEPYARVAAALVRPLVAAEEAGRLRLGPDERDDRKVSDVLATAVAPVSEGLLPGMPAVKVVLVVEAWTTLIGAISLEVFGHWRKTVLEPELLFEDSMRRLGESLGLGSG